MAPGDLFRSLEDLAQSTAGVESLEAGEELLRVRVFLRGSHRTQRLTRPVLHRDRTPGGGREVGRVIGARTKVRPTGSPGGGREAGRVHCAPHPLPLSQRKRGAVG